MDNKLRIFIKEDNVPSYINTIVFVNNKRYNHVNSLRWSLNVDSDKDEIIMTVIDLDGEDSPITYEGEVTYKTLYFSDYKIIKYKQLNWQEFFMVLK